MRKDSREVALKILYSASFSQELDPQEEIFGYSCLKEQDKNFCDQLLCEYKNNYSLLIEQLGNLSTNYSVERMFEVDKIVLLLAMTELKCFLDIPPLVTIKEAMELAKKYSSEDSVVFINGILGAYKTFLER